MDVLRPLVLRFLMQSQQLVETSISFSRIAEHWLYWF